jgi:hypothetical protein
VPRSLVLVCLLACAFAPAPQESSNRPELSDRQKEFLKEVQKTVDLADKLALAKLFRKETPIAQEIVEAYCNAYAVNGDPTLFDDVKTLVEQIDGVQECKVLQRRVEFLKKIKDDRAAWIEVKNRYDAVWTQWQEADTKKEEAVWKKAATAFEEVVNMAAKVGDLEIASICRFHLAICQDNSSQYDAAGDSCKQAMQEWEPAGRSRNDQYKWMETRLAELAKKGYGPDKPKVDKDKGNPSAPATAPAKTYSKTSYKEGSQFQEWVGEYKEMQSPDQFPSTSPYNTDFLNLWREFNFAEKGGPFQLGTLAAVAPFGAPLKVVRDGSKAFLRSGDDKKSDAPVKILDNKPTLASVKNDDPKNPERYAVFLCTGGGTATFMQTPMNYQTLGRYRSGWYREGKVLGETVVLLDDNSSGLMGDALEVKDNITPGNPDWIDLDGILVGKKLMPWTEVIPIGGKWYSFELGVGDVHGKQIRTRELDIETGQVVVKWNGPVPPRLLIIEEMHELKGCYYDVAGGKPVTVPVGHYEIGYGELEQGKAGQIKQAWILRGASKQFDVVANQTVTLDMGAPYKIDFELDRKGGKSITVKGKMVVREKSGAIVARIYDEAVFPEVWTRNGTTGNGTAGKPMTKSDEKTRAADNAAIWFPGPYVIDLPAKDAKIQVALKLAKHPLLGGPFASDWK